MLLHFITRPNVITTTSPGPKWFASGLSWKLNHVRDLRGQGNWSHLQAVSATCTYAAYLLCPIGCPVAVKCLNNIQYIPWNINIGLLCLVLIRGGMIHHDHDALWFHCLDDMNPSTYFQIMEQYHTLQVVYNPQNFHANYIWHLLHRNMSDFDITHGSNSSQECAVLQITGLCIPNMLLLWLLDWSLKF